MDISYLTRLLKASYLKRELLKIIMRINLSFVAIEYCLTHIDKKTNLDTFLARIFSRAIDQVCFNRS